jgi:hypothetical protein
MAIDSLYLLKRNLPELVRLMLETLERWISIPRYELAEGFSPRRPLPWRKIMVDIEPALVAFWGRFRDGSLGAEDSSTGGKGSKFVDKKSNFLSYYCS